MFVALRRRMGYKRMLAGVVDDYNADVWIAIHAMPIHYRKNIES